MGNFLLYAVYALFSFFGAGPLLLNTISLFTVQKNFAKVMVEKGVISEEHVRMIHPKKEIAGVLISGLALTAVILSLLKHNDMIGFFAAGLPFLVSLVKYREILQFNNLTVSRFKNTYKGLMDEKKYNKYIEEHF